MRISLIAAAVLAAAGCLIFGWVMSVPMTKSGGGTVMAIILFALLIGISVVQFVSYQKGRRRVPNFKTGKPLIFAAIAITALGFLGAIENSELNDTLQKYVKDDWDVGASLPDDPKFVMYDMKKILLSRECRNG